MSSLLRQSNGNKKTLTFLLNVFSDDTNLVQVPSNNTSVLSKVPAVDPSGVVSSPVPSIVPSTNRFTATEPQGALPHHSGEVEGNLPSLRSRFQEMMAPTPPSMAKSTSAPDEFMADPSEPAAIKASYNVGKRQVVDLNERQESDLARKSMANQKDDNIYQQTTKSWSFNAFEVKKETMEEGNSSEKPMANLKDDNNYQQTMEEEDLSEAMMEDLSSKSSDDHDEKNDHNIGPEEDYEDL